MFDVTNSIWYRENYSFEEAFMDRCRTFFGAEIRGVNFCDAGVPSLINGWVSDHTNGRIEEMVDDPIPNCGALVMMLMNAIYFKGGWTHPFDPENTYDTWFNLPDGSRKPCKMMAQTWKYDHFSNDLFKAVDLPYGDSTFTMTILCPESNVELDQLISQLTPENWDSWMSSFSKDSIDVYLPRFTLEYEKEMKDVLSSLGMSIAFSGGADFTRMYSPGGLFISKVKHKTFLQVDEEGAEGAAATQVDFQQSLGFSIYVDEPFVFAIREKSTNTILFIGKVVDATFI